VDVPEVVTGLFENDALVLEGSPAMLRLTELLPPTATRLTVIAPLLLRLIVSEGADNKILKSTGTFNVTVVTWVAPVRVSMPVTVSV
jgi:hypothetical protein